MNKNLAFSNSLKSLDFLALNDWGGINLTIFSNPLKLLDFLTAGEFKN